MPIYEYECKNCHHHFDLIQKINDLPETYCKNCQKETAVRLISAAGFQLKGNGWYVTDFKNKEKKSQPKKEEVTASPETKEKTAAKKEEISTVKPTTVSQKGEKD